MIRYNKVWLDNLLIKKEAQRFFIHSWISAEKLKEIRNFYKEEFISHHTFSRLGVYLFTLLATAAGISFIFLVMGLHESNSLFLVFSILVFVGLFIAIQAGHYKSGIDDALLHIALLLFSYGISSDIFRLGNSETILFLIVLVIAIILFSDMAVAAYAWFTFILLIFTNTIKFRTGFESLTLIIMGMGTAFYFFTEHLLKKENLRYWKESLAVIKILAILTTYAGSTQHFQAGYHLFDLTAQFETGNALEHGEAVQPSIAYYKFLYYLSILLPIMFISRSLWTKDRILLILGLVTFFHSIFFKLLPYFPLDYLLLFSGFFLITLAYAGIRYLGLNRFGFIYKDDNERAMDAIGIDEEAGNIINTNALSATTESINANQPGTKFRGGGGKFGGGGADDSF